MQNCKNNLQYVSIRSNTRHDQANRVTEHTLLKPYNYFHSIGIDYLSYKDNDSSRSDEQLYTRCRMSVVLRAWRELIYVETYT